MLRQCFCRRSGSGGLLTVARMVRAAARRDAPVFDELINVSERDGSVLRFRMTAASIYSKAFSEL
jgi:hypothetical protein